MLPRRPRETVARCLFPLGGRTGKDEVRADARGLGLTAADKPDSMDICFIPDGDVSGWLERHGAACPPGNFVDETGRVLGRHKGLHCYTVGQRKGLGVAAEGRLFVHALRPETNEVVLSLSDVYRSEITVRAMHYIAPEYAANGPFCCEVRVRYSRRSDRATVYPTENGARIVFESAVRAPAKGQSAVLYDGDIVIGGGFIESEQSGGEKHGGHAEKQAAGASVQPVYHIGMGADRCIDQGAAAHRYAAGDHDRALRAGFSRAAACRARLAEGAKAHT